MLNAVRMDLYRMFHTKSLYVIWIVMGVLIVFTTSLSKTDYEDTQIQAENHQFYQEQEENGENTVMLGMQVILPTDPGEKVTLSDILYANIQGKFVAVFLAIFAVLFSSADMNSGDLCTLNIWGLSFHPGGFQSDHLRISEVGDHTGIPWVSGRPASAAFGSCSDLYGIGGDPKEQCVQYDPCGRAMHESVGQLLWSYR